MFAEAFEEKSAPWSDIKDHLQFIHDTVRSYAAPRVIELGVRSGNSTAAILAALEDVGGHLWSCDISTPAVPQEWHESPLWTFMLGDSVARAPDMPPQCDVLFIDTSHTYEQTLAELQSYVPKARPGGIVLMHDTQWLFPNISLPAPGGPVTEALDVFCAEAGLDWENRDSKEGWGYGLGVIRVR